MKSIFRMIGVALFLTFVACGSGAGGPVGVWKVDPDATLAANEDQIEAQLQSLPPAGRAKGRENFESLFKSLRGTIELRADKTLYSETQMGEKKQVMSGSWELDGDKVRMKSRLEGSELENVTVGSVVSGQMTVNTVGTEQFVVLTKQDD
jgi:hypothetical protein